MILKLNVRVLKLKFVSYNISDVVTQCSEKRMMFIDDAIVISVWN